MKFSTFSNIEESATLLMNGLAMKKKREGHKVYNLSVGEPLVDTDVAIIDAAIDAMKRGETHYAPGAGIEELRNASAHWMNTNFNTSYTSVQTIVTCGGKSGLQMLCQTFIEAGDEAIIIAPYWVSYKSMVEMYGGKVVVVETEEKNEWKATADDIKKLMSDRTKLLFINNASNPTGVLYSKEELIEILRIARQHGILVISDEVYGSLVYGEETYYSCAGFTEFADNVVVVQSMSKHFGMTGWRVGFVFADQEIIKRLITLQGQSTSGTSTISQWAAVAAFENAERVIQSVKNAVRARRDIFVDTFSSLFDTNLSKPKSAFYFFVSLEALGVDTDDSFAFCRKVLEEADVALVPGVAFGKEGYVRMSFGGHEKDIVEALQVLREYLKK